MHLVDCLHLCHAHTIFQSVTTIRKHLRVLPYRKGKAVPVYMMTAYGMCSFGPALSGPHHYMEVSGRMPVPAALIPPRGGGLGLIALGDDCLRVWVVPRVSLDALEKGKVSSNWNKILTPFSIFLYNKPLFRSVLGICCVMVLWTRLSVGFSSFHAYGEANKA